MQNPQSNLDELKQEQIAKIKQRQEDKILEKENAEFLTKLIENAESKEEVLKLSALGMSLKRTGFHFDVRLEKSDGTIKYFKKNEKLSFKSTNGKSHTLIIGDNYPALLNLLINYKRKVKVIYIDPPYGKDDLGEFAKTNYDNAITRDNLLSMLYPRLSLAKMLLQDDGVIFCSIDDRNQAYVKGLFDEVFGEGNFISNLCVVDNLKGNNNTEGISQTNEYCLIYAKDKSSCRFGDLLVNDDEGLEKWNLDEFGYWKEGRNIKGTGENAPREKRPSMFYPIYLNDKMEISLQKSDEFYIEVLPLTNGQEMCWNWGKEFLEKNKHELIVKKTENGFNFIKKQRPALGDLPSKKMKTTCYSPRYSTSVSSNTIKDIFNNERVFNYTKSIYLIKDLLKISTTNPSDYVDLQVDSMDCHDFANAKSRNDKGAYTNATTTGGGGISPHSLESSTQTEPEIILDFFAGSGTTAHAVMELNREDGGNRKAILVTNNEKTELNPNGIAYDVTTKRLKRIMSGSCYDGGTNFKWREKNEPYGDGLEVLEIESLSDTDLNIFDKIDEKLYGKDFTHSKQEKIKWVCENFEATCKSLESTPLWVGAGFRVRNNKHLESSEKVDFSDMDSMDCHDFANAKSRNDKKLESTKKGE